ncbi:hypothetical protein M5X00_28860 [Paenibacillus alvei]|uniref:Uncharacterized protein n=1 Tax=Paenibacillus alvei TaxID=44250 RepID=A0ABT4GW62_PAEAL|nr:hypothetical protein [Paenibacillus alvei]EJW19120.1 hypothetical protein PAV_1c00910 [Paenibacillus alvei DSM 29]MCY7487843.1 hypothetical protein [Paenibacillus alvei]MCY9542288.1 hypothetical protein [Paenibacillus alvei]MCY9707275.1 hypothetical protein [Paenibacillus alvei]MCY9736188.1 hypothetical protein [Paenibacillus alvei]
MEYLFNRGCEILIGGYRFNYGDLTMNVHVDFDDNHEPNESTVELYNLSKHTLANIRTGMRVIVNAGYGKDLGTVLQGNIVEVRTKREQMDRVTTIQVKDDLTVSVYEMAHTYRPGTKASEIIHDLLSRVQIPHGAVQLGSNHSYMKGFVVKGDPVASIRRAARDCNTEVFTRQGKLYFKPLAGAGLEVTGIVLLSADSGLIDSPQSYEEDKVKGVRVTSLLNYRLYADAQLRLVSEDFDGVYRVKRGKHIISMDQFVTEVDLVKI